MAIIKHFSSNVVRESKNTGIWNSHQCKKRTLVNVLPAQSRYISMNLNKKYNNLVLLSMNNSHTQEQQRLPSKLVCTIYHRLYNLCFSADSWNQHLNPPNTKGRFIRDKRSREEQLPKSSPEMSVKPCSKAVQHWIIIKSLVSQ